MQHFDFIVARGMHSIELYWRNKGGITDYAELCGNPVADQSPIQGHRTDHNMLPPQHTSQGIRTLFTEPYKTFLGTPKAF